MVVDRMSRINSQLARELSVLVAREIKDKAVENAVITSVECSRDLKYAKVYFTSMDRTGRKAMGEALNKTAGFLRSRLGHMLSLRTVPQLTFVFDTSEEQARQIDALLDKLMSETSERAEDHETDVSIL